MVVGPRPFAEPGSFFAMRTRSFDATRYSREALRREAAALLTVVRDCPSFEVTQ